MTNLVTILFWKISQKFPRKFARFKPITNGLCVSGKNYRWIKKFVASTSVYRLR